MSGVVSFHDNLLNLISDIELCKCFMYCFLKLRIYTYHTTRTDLGYRTSTMDLWFSRLMMLLWANLFNMAMKHVPKLGKVHSFCIYTYLHAWFDDVFFCKKHGNATLLSVKAPYQMKPWFWLTRHGVGRSQCAQCITLLKEKPARRTTTHFKRTGFRLTSTVFDTRIQ